MRMVTIVGVDFALFDFSCCAEKVHELVDVDSSFFFVDVVVVALGGNTLDVDDATTG